jgi:hypothetical protein
MLSTCFDRIIDHIADLMYHCVSGCMTAQVAHEVNYQNANPTKTAPVAEAAPVQSPIANPSFGTVGVVHAEPIHEK